MVLKWLLQHVGILLPVTVMLLASLSCHAQSYAIKNDAMYNALLIPNLGMEFKTYTHTTIDIEGTYDPISFPSNKQWKNWSVQPEVRFWGCKPFSGMFVGINAIAGGFNVARVPLFGFNEKRVQCRFFYGGGITLGNNYVLSPRWGVETKISLGVVHFEYSRYRCGTCGYKEADIVTNYAGPTNMSVALIYIIK